MCPSPAVPDLEAELRCTAGRLRDLAARIRDHFADPGDRASAAALDCFVRTAAEVAEGTAARLTTVDRP